MVRMYIGPRVDVISLNILGPSVSVMTIPILKIQPIHYNYSRMSRYRNNSKIKFLLESAYELIIRDLGGIFEKLASSGYMDI